MNHEASPHQLKSEARNNLDGGLDTRSGIFGKPGRATSLFNMTFQQTDHLTVRQGGTMVARPLTPYSGTNVTTTGFFPASSFTAVDVPGAGSIAAATYNVRYALTTLMSSNIAQEYVTSEVVNVTAAGGASAIDIRIYANDCGETAGSDVTNGADLPGNCGYRLSTTIANAGAPQIFMKTGADGYTKQVITSITWTKPGSGKPYYAIRVAAYSNTGTAIYALALGRVSMRSLVAATDLDALFGWLADRAVYLHGPAATSYKFFGQGIDKNGVTYGFSRWPSKVMATVLDRVMWAFDGIGKPKRLHWTGDPETSKWLIGGANAPADPTVTDTGAGSGPGAGVYYYAISFIYTYKAMDGTLRTVESAPSAAKVVTSTAKTITVAWTASLETSPLNSDGTSSSVPMVRVYRTNVGGTQLYKLKDVKDSTGSPYSDDGSDSVNVDITPTDSLGKVSPEVPPAKLYFPCEHDGRLWASPQLHDLDATTLEILRLHGTATLRFTEIDENGLNPDSWPSDYEVPCGQGRITGTWSFRGTLYVFKEDGIGVIEGSDPNSYGYREIFSGLGALAGSLVVVGTEAYFWDNCKGPCRMSGYSAEAIGTEDVQVYWLSQRTLNPFIRDAFYDRTRNEIRWITTSIQNSSAYWALEPRIEEFVLYFPEGGKPAFHIDRAQAATVALTSDRRITGVAMAIGSTVATDPAARNLYPYYCDTYGRYCQDGTVYCDAAPTAAEAIPIDGVAVFPYFFGNDPTMSKLDRFLYLIYEMGGISDYINVAVYFLGQVPITFASLTGNIFGSASLVGVDQVKRADFPSTLGNLEQRGVKVQVTMRSYALAGVCRLKYLDLRYRDVSNLRNV